MRVQNNGQDAYEAMFYLQLPQGIEYINIENQNAAQDVVIQCNAPRPSNNNTLRCDIGNPLAENSIVQFKVYLEPLTFHGMKAAYNLPSWVNSTNQEEDSHTRNNYYELTLPIWTKTDLYIEGDGRPKDIYFNPFNYTDSEPSLDMSESEFGPIITHNYTILNRGPSTVLSLNATLVWPAETFAGDVLLYLLEQPEVSLGSKVQCDSANANYLSLKLEQRKGFRSLIQNTVLKSRDQLYRNFTNNNYYSLNSLPEDREEELPLNPQVDFGAEGYSSKVNSKSYQLRQSENRRYTQTRSKRGTHHPLEKVVNLPINKAFLCNTAKCVDLHCQVGPLEKAEEVWIAARYRISARTLKKVANQEKVIVGSQMSARVTRLPFIGEPTEDMKPPLPAKVRTEVQSMSVPVGTDVVPLWVVVLSASAGTAILLLLVYLLYKCGFFNRNRPTHTPERQPLNSRGRDY